MNSQSILKTLDQFVRKEAARRGVEEYRVLQRRSISEIAKKKPQTKEELEEVYGIGEAKLHRYGDTILSIVDGSYGSSQNEDKGSTSEGESEVVSVSEFIQRINTNLKPLSARVQGEITEISQRRNSVYFTIKDDDDGSNLSCFMWKSDFDISDIKAQEGMEVVCDGFPRVYPATGRLSLQVKVLEYAGEGALRMAYEKLKKKLTK